MRTMLFCIATLVAACNAATPYDGLMFVHAELSQNASNMVTEDETWGYSNGISELVVSKSKLEELRQAGVRVEVIHENVAAVIEAERKRVLDAAVGYTPKVHGTRNDPFFFEYRPWNQYEEFLANLVSNYSHLVSASTMGHTSEGRSIPVYTIRSRAGPAQKPAVYIQAVVHAREWLANAATAYILNALVTEYGINGEITSLLDAVDFHIAPTVNIDGYVFTWTSSGNRMWRKNRRLNAGGSFGVDINRNWGPASTWCTAGSSTTPSSDTYCGTAPFSEPETQAARSFINSHINIRAAIDMHTSGPLILWPWQYSTNRLPEPSYSMFVNLGARMQAAIASVHGVQYISQQGVDLYPHSGGLIDYCWSESNIKSFTFEGRGPGFNPPASNIIPAGEEQLRAVILLGRDTLNA